MPFEKRLAIVETVTTGIAIGKRRSQSRFPARLPSPNSEEKSLEGDGCRL
jgi:hypothetical protein